MTQKRILATIAASASALILLPIGLATAKGSVPRVDGSAATPAYPKNARGETYGSALGAANPESEPDLILAYGTDGTLGYVRKLDLEPPAPKSPKEALAGNANAKSAILLPLYAQDGVTVIGKFRQSAGTESYDKP